MKGYGVHLLFHLLALAVGAAFGVAAAIWWFGHGTTALWLALAAVVAAILLLVLQGFYIAGSGPPSAPRNATSSEPRPAGTRRGDTAIQRTPSDVRAYIDQDTRTPASEALHDHGQA